MQNPGKVVNGFRFMPPSLGAWIGKDIPPQPFSGNIPWSPLKNPASKTTFTLMTSAGISMKTEPAFDVEKEKREPAWGDPSSRRIPAAAGEKDIDVNHLHINTEYIKQDINVILPIKRFKEFEKEGIIGRLAPNCYSYYGFQPNPDELLTRTMPKVADQMRTDSVEAVLLTPA